MPKYRIDNSDMEFRGRAKRQWDNPKYQTRHNMISSGESMDDGIELHARQKRSRHEKKWKDI